MFETKIKNGLRFILLIITLLLTGSALNVNCQLQNEEEYKFEVDFSIYISNFFIENNTAILDVNLWIRNLTLDADNITLKFMDNYYEIVCNSSGANSFYGKLEKKFWYVKEYGEFFPFDYHRIRFQLDPYSLEYEKNGNRYGLRDWNYTFSEDVTVKFSGWFKISLDDVWDIYKIKKINDLNGFEEYLIYFLRKPLMLYIHYVWFLMLLHLLICLTPSLTAFSYKSRSLRIRFYSSLLVFSPMFIFTLQNFLPPRKIFTLPEMLCISIILFSTFMITVSFRDLDEKYANNEKQRVFEYFLYDIFGFLGSCIVYYFIQTDIFRKAPHILLQTNMRLVWFIYYSIILIGIIFEIIFLQEHIPLFKGKFKILKIFLSRIVNQLRVRLRLIKH